MNDRFKFKAVLLRIGGKGMIDHYILMFCVGYILGDILFKLVRR